MNSMECLAGTTAPMATLTIPGRAWAAAIQAHFARLGGVELELADRADRPCDQPFA
jgi:hypothetical protein